MKISNQKYDVIIPVAQKDVTFVKQVVKFINKYILECENIYIITNIKNFHNLSSLSTKVPNLKILDENVLIPGLSFSIVHEYMQNNGEFRINGVGWYFQQLLKFAFAKSKWAKKYYLSWDADTIPLNPLSFFDDEHPLFTKKIEYHEPYFKTIEKLLGFGKLSECSFIAEHMLFKTSIMNELIDNIANNKDIKGTTWVEKIIMACDFSDKRGFLFSEFETYGNYCMKNYPNLYEMRQLNTFRAAGLIKGRRLSKRVLTRLALDLNIASFEQQDAPFPYNISWFFITIVR